MIKIYPDIKKSHVIEIFGSNKSAASALDMTPSALSQWPNNLTEEKKHRVFGAIFFMNKRRRYYEVMEESGVGSKLIK